MQIYTYNQDNDYYEFIIYENTVVKVQCFGKWKYDKRKMIYLLCLVLNQQKE